MSISLLVEGAIEANSVSHVDSGEFRSPRSRDLDHLILNTCLDSPVLN